MALPALFGVELAAWCALVFALGLILIVGAFVTAILGTLAGFSIRLPFIGSPTASIIHRVEASITHALGRAEQAIDGAAGWAWHTMARQVDWLGREIERHASLLARIAALLLVVPGIGEVTALVNALRSLIHANAGTASSAVHRVGNVEKRLSRATFADVLPRLGRLEREYDHVITHDIPSLRAAERAIEDGALNTWKWIRTHPLSLAATAFAGAVAVALHRLGGSWIRCANWNRIGRSVCGLPLSLIEDLFAATVVGFAVTDICEFASIAQGVAQVFEPELMALVDLEDALVGCHGATGVPALTLPALVLPPDSLSLPLAA